MDSTGKISVADTSNNTIRVVTSAGVVSTLAGSVSPGSADGTGSTAGFYSPGGIYADGSVTLFVGDSGNNTVRKVTAAGVVTTLAGAPPDGGPGYVDATGSAARFNSPRGVAVDSAGNTYVADLSNSLIRKVTPAGVVTTFAGGFSNPWGVAVGSDGTVYVADTYNNAIRKITPGGVVTTLAGLPGYFNSGNVDGQGSAARFNFPQDVAVDSNNNIVYVADTRNDSVRKITPDGTVTTLTTGIGAGGVAVDTAGTVYVADSGGLVRKVTQAGAVSTLAGSVRLRWEQ